MGSKALANYFATSDTVQYSRLCMDIMDAMPLTETGEGTTSGLKKLMISSLLTTSSVYKYRSAYCYSYIYETL